MSSLSVADTGFINQYLNNEITSSDVEDRFNVNVNWDTYCQELAQDFGTNEDYPIFGSECSSTPDSFDQSETQNEQNADSIKPEPNPQPPVPINTPLECIPPMRQNANSMDDLEQLPELIFQHDIYYYEPDEYYQHVHCLGMLCWVARNHYRGGTPELRQLILFLIKRSMVQIFKFHCYRASTIHHNFDRTEGFLKVLGQLVTRLHIKSKYYDLRNMESSEFENYVSMMEGRMTIDQIETEKKIMEEARLNKKLFEGHPSDIFQISRQQIQDLIDNYKNQRMNIVLELLYKLVDQPNGTLDPAPTKETELPTSDNINIPVEIADTIPEPKQLPKLDDETSKHIYDKVISELPRNETDSTLNITEEELNEAIDNDDIVFEMTSDQETIEHVSNEFRFLSNSIPTSTPTSTPIEVSNNTDNDISIDNSKEPEKLETGCLESEEPDTPMLIEPPMESSLPPAQFNFGFISFDWKTTTVDNLVDVFYQDGLHTPQEETLRYLIDYFNEIQHNDDCHGVLEGNRVLYEMKYFIYLVTLLMAEKLL